MRHKRPFRRYERPWWTPEPAPQDPNAGTQVRGAARPEGQDRAPYLTDAAPPAGGPLVRDIDLLEEDPDEESPGTGGKLHRLRHQGPGQAGVLFVAGLALLVAVMTKPWAGPTAGAPEAPASEAVQGVLETQPPAPAVSDPAATPAVSTPADEQIWVILPVDGSAPTPLVGPSRGPAPTPTAR